MTCASSTDGIPAGFQDLQNVCDHGFVTTTNMTFNSAAPTVQIGDASGNAALMVYGPNAQQTLGSGTGSPWLRFNKIDAGTTDIQFKVAGVNRWILRFNASEDLDFRRFNAAGVYQDSTTIDETTHLWTYPGSATYNSASPDVRIGDGTGSPSILLNKSAAGFGSIWFQDVGIVRWQLDADASENLAFNRYNGAGVYQDTAYIDQGSGAWSYPGSATYNSASPVVTIGDGTGSPQLIINQSADETAYIEIQNASTRIGRIYFGTGVPAIAAVNGDHYWNFDNTGNTIYKYVAGAWALQC